MEGRFVDWRLEVARLAILGRLPFGAGLRRMKRRVFGYAPNVGNLLGALRNLDEMETELASLGRSFAAATVLEIGSGWFPAIPVTLSLRGAEKVFLSDLNQHMDESTFTTTLQFLNQHTPSHPRLRAAKGIDDFALVYLAPFNVADIADASLDLIISRTVLEHIFPAPLTSLLVALRPKLKPDGLMVHYIDHSDHLEHSDKSLSKINFLTWSTRRHSLVNRLTKEGENRLRHHEYGTLFEAAGYAVVRTKTHLHEPTQAVVPSLRLAEPFRRMAPEQLATLSSIYIVAPRTPTAHAPSGVH